MARQTRHRRFISLVGDAELDEGSVWEAIAEPGMTGVGEVLWIVDLNRQSLDRVIPGIRVRCWREMFAANGWDVIDVKYGRLLQAAFDQPNGELLRICIDELSNDAYQRLLRLPPARTAPVATQEESLPGRFTATTRPVGRRPTARYILESGRARHPGGGVGADKINAAYTADRHLRLYVERMETAFGRASAESFVLTDG